MEDIISDFIIQYPKNKKFEDFIKFFYNSFDKKIKMERKVKEKNKYKRMRDIGLSYIISNKLKISSQIRNN